MNDAQEINYDEKFKKADRASDEMDEAHAKEQHFNVIETNDRASKEQICLNDSSKCDVYSNLFRNKNYTNKDYISSKKDEPLAGLNDIRKVCDDFNNGNDGISCKSVSSKSNNNQSECHQKEINGLSKLTDMKNSGSTMSDSNESVYFVIYFPYDFALPGVVDEKDCLHVYTDKEEVLKMMKSNKKARFKQFKTKKEAEDFAANGAEILSQEGSSTLADNEKIMPFKRPKTEEMIQFRKDIERGDIEAVRQKIFENPKYLVSNGDTPSILQEGSRYNALHVAAKAKNAKITQLILDSITRVDFIRYLYDENDLDSCVSRSEVLLDRYLNTPDKGSNETPLHLAVKHGAVEVVQVLLSYSQCQKNDIYNRYNELPRDIICSRVYEPCEEKKTAIASMLDEQYFVPVLRSADNSLQPKVGEAFSLGKPLKLESDLLSPRLEIQAYAGPMSKEKADLFKKKWKIPTRSARDLNSSLSSRLRDTEKGLEKTGRNLASELQVPWQEYWPFLDTFVDISSQQGLQLLENYLKSRFNETFESAKKKDEDSGGESSDQSFSPINDFGMCECENFEVCGSQGKSPANSNPLPKRHPSSSPSSSQRGLCCKKGSESFEIMGKNPLVYVERSCEVFGNRIGAAINSWTKFGEDLEESLKTQVKRLMVLIKSYKEDNRFQSVDFQLFHSRVAAIAIQNIQDVLIKHKRLILTGLEEIELDYGELSDDEDLNHNRNCNNERMGVITKQLQCLAKCLITQIENDKKTGPHLSPSAIDEAGCRKLWSLAYRCRCTWGKTGGRRARGGLKWKQHRRACDTVTRKIRFDDEKDEASASASTVKDSEDHFSTPSSGNSDAEDMEDVKEIPNTFIHAGSLPTKTDFAVLEAIEKVPLSADMYPNIYLWRHILKIQPKNVTVEHQTSTPESFHRRILNFDSPKSSPRKLPDRSSGSCESPPMHAPLAEPWERVTGPYSPRRSTRSPPALLFCESPAIGR